MNDEMYLSTKGLKQTQEQGQGSIANRAQIAALADELSA